MEAVPAYPNPQGELFRAAGFGHQVNQEESWELGKKIAGMAAKAALTVSLLVAPIEEVALGGLAALGAKVEGFFAKETILINGSGPTKGILEVSNNVKSTKAFENYSPKKPVDFVFDSNTSRMAVATKGTSPKGHTTLAKSINANEKTVVGGRLKKGADGTIQTSEWSGHYGQNWTPEIRNTFKKFLGEQVGKKVEHSGNMLFNNGTK